MKFITGAVSLVVSLFCATALFWAGIAFEHRPAGWPSYTLRLGPFSHTFGLPELLGAQLAALKAAEAKAAVQAKAIQAAQAEVSVSAGQHDAIAQTQIRTVTQTIYKDIPYAIPAAVDHAYPLPNGLVRLYDASVLGVDAAAISNPAGQPDAAPSAVTASAAEGVFVTNNGQCRAAYQQLGGLQDWVRAEAAASH